MKRSSAVLVGAFIGAAGYAAFVRPRSLRWGSTWRERYRVWAGDEFMPEPVTQSTRVVTIQAPAERVWPWVAQLGQDRGGFYTYTALENLVGAQMTNAEEVHPEWQHRDPGENLWLGARDKFDGKAHMIVARWIPGRSMVLVAPPDWERIRSGSSAASMVWSFMVEPVDKSSCRLVVRTLGGDGQTTRDRLANYIFWEPAHFIMERGMMLGIKSRAESAESARQPWLPVRIVQTAAGIAGTAAGIVGTVQKVRSLAT